MNTAYIYRKDKRGKGSWKAIGHYCTRCKALGCIRSVKLSEGVSLNPRPRRSP